MIDGTRDSTGPRRSVVAVIMATAGTTIIGTCTVLTFRGRLPDPVATQWGADGAEGFAALATTLALAAGLLTGLGLLFVAVVAQAAPHGRHRLTGLLVGVVTGLGVGIYATVLMQAGIDDARHASKPEFALALGAAAGAVGGVIAARVSSAQLAEAR